MLDQENISDCIEQIKEYAEDSIPVLTQEGKIVGIITSSDIVEVVDDEMGDDYAKLAGLTAEEDLHEYEEASPLVDYVAFSWNGCIICRRGV